MKKSVKFLSFLLMMILLVNMALPIAATQQAPDGYLPSDNTTEESAFGKELKDPELLQQELDELTYEITSLRDANIKHFQLADGSYQAVVYGAPVHRLNDSGEWEEIDNSLSDTNGAMSTPDSRVKFTKKITGNGEIYTLHNGSYKVTVGLVGAQKKVEGIITDQSVSEDGMTKLQKLINVDHIASGILYSDILDGVDLEYIVISNSIKENVIIHEPAEQYSYSFTLSLNGLEAKLENGSILLYDPSSEDVIYTIPTPYMYDADGNESLDVFYTLTKTGNGKYEYTLTADAEWINAEGRSFPVVIDPSLLDIGQTDDTYVTPSSPTTKYGGNSFLFLTTTSQVYYKFATPHLPTGTNITSAVVNLPYYYDTTTNIYATVELYQITAGWNEDHVTWNTKPSLASNCLDTQDLYAGTATYEDPQNASYSITDYVRSWYTGTANHGFALKRVGGSASSVKFVAKERMHVFAQLTINYTGTHLAEGVYAIQKSGTNCYLKSYIPSNLGWILQDTSYSAPPLTTSTLETLFKICYRPEHNDYVIRSMIDSSVVVYPNLTNNAPLTRRRPESDTSLSTGCTWKIEYADGDYYIFYDAGDTRYYAYSTDNTHDNRLRFTTDPDTPGTKWSFHKYTGNEFEDVEKENFDGTLSVGDEYQYKFYMRSTRIGHNGPVTYSVTDTDNTSTTKATVDSSTGALTALETGEIKLKVTYAGAPWVWYSTVNISGYLSADLAAVGFMKEIYPSCKYILHEYGTKIYSMTTSEGTTVYDYGTIVSGGPHGVVPGLSEIPDEATYVATAHTHPNRNDFSPRDKENAQTRGKNSYVMGPNLNVRKYTVSTQANERIATITLNTLTDEQKAALVAEFQESWNEHISYTDASCPNGFDCKNTTWPNP